MKSIRSRGFTLIELLVVIAIIGLLASIILASLNTARQKGRDAARVAALKEMANAMEATNNGTQATALAGCAPTTSTGVNINTCTVPAGLTGYADPGVGASGTLCTKTSTAACQYAIFTTAAGTANTQNYEVCTYLESGSGGLTSGMVSVSASSSDSLTQGCF
jgi:prepilin-type N-terminal cleavage/methylation domain-containing protein